jgi:hypothetical protein
MVKLHPESVSFSKHYIITTIEAWFAPEIANKQNNLGNWRKLTGVVLVIRKLNWQNPRWS